MLDSPNAAPLVVHIERMKGFTARKDKSKLKRKDEDRFEVLKIMKKREIPQDDGITKTEYQVRWKGYKAKDDTWVPAKDMNAKELLHEFEEHERAKKRIEV